MALRTELRNTYVVKKSDTPDTRDQVARIARNTAALIDLGRDQVEARMARFLSIYEPTIAPLGRRAGGVDMRYGNGFAVRVPGLAQVKEPGAPATPAVAPKAAKPKA